MPPKKKTDPAKGAAAAGTMEVEKKEASKRPRAAEVEAEDAGIAKKEARRDEDTEDAQAVVEVGEKEIDSAVDKRAVVREAISFDPVDTTLNIIPTLGGKVLMALTDGGMQYLIAGARASVGARGGRHLFEVRIVETLNPMESATVAQAKAPKPRQLIRVGVSTSSSQLVLGEGTGGACFDSEGSYTANGTKTMAAQPFNRDHVIGVLLNLDPRSPNANTLSLFRNGERISEPQALPEELRGQTLFPHVAFRNVSVHVHFGPQPLAPLPFKCRTWAGAAQADVVVRPPSVPKDGKYEVMFPVAFPDEGTFDWLDEYLEQNPHFVELSDRTILEWATQSGLRKPKSSYGRDSNDRPDFNFGLPGMDDLSARKVINAVAPVVPRHYVIMEVKGNLVAADRAEVLRRFSAPHYKRVAHVVMGEPTDKYKESQRSKILDEKQARADSERALRQAEVRKKKELLKRQRLLTEMRKQAEEKRRVATEMAQKAAEEAAKRKAEGAKKAAEEAAEEGDKDAAKAEGDAEAGEGAKDAAAASVQLEDEDEKKLQEVAKQEAAAEKEKETEQAKAEEAKAEEEDEEMKEEEPLVVELTDEEKNKWFQAKSIPDLTPLALGQAFGNFTIPDKAEGFSEVRFEWQNATASKEYLRKWVVEKKVTARIEDLEPSSWFRGKVEEWRKTYTEWQQKQKKYQDDHPKKGKADGDKAIDDLPNFDEEKETDDLDIFSIEDVCDVGNGEPLFVHFAFEDWAMLQMRYELYLLVHSYRRDVDDHERVGIHESNFVFYYNKYYRKQLSSKHFGVNTNAELCDLVKDTVTINRENHVLVSQLSEDMENVDIFVKLTEESRRERQRRIDAGDETARIKFSPLALQQPQPAKVGSGVATVMPAGPVGQVKGKGAVQAAGRVGQWPYRSDANSAGKAGGGSWRPPGAQAGMRQPGSQNKWW